MFNYKSIIKRDAELCVLLHKNVYETYANRNKSPHSLKDWQKACSDFRSHLIAMDEKFKEIAKASLVNDVDARQFAFDYLSVDPYCFTSGYKKEWLVRKIKPLDLSENEKEVVRHLILERLDVQMTRDFKEICKLARLVSDASFENTITTIVRSETGLRQKRAQLVLSSFHV